MSQVKSTATAPQDSVTKDPNYEPLALADIPKDKFGNVLIDLYVYLPASRQYVLFVARGEPFGETRRNALMDHTVPALFVESQAAIEIAPSSSSRSFKSQELEVLGHGTTRALHQLYDTLKVSDTDSAKDSIEVLTTLSTRIIDVLAPNIHDLRDRLVRGLDCLWLMDDAAAVTSLSIFIAIANGMDSRKTLRDFVPACLVMDLPLLRFGPEKLLQARMDPSKLDTKLRTEYQAHPVLAYKMAKSKLTQITETTLELILCHHELNNGEGFPRGLRSGTLFPASRVLALAADCFDQLKISMATAGGGKNLKLVLEDMLNAEEEPHKRRHQKELITKTIDSLKAMSTS